MSYKSRIPQIVAGLATRIELTEAEVADRVVEAAKARVPQRTGKLRDAIHKEKADGDGYWVIAGNGEAFYGHIVEHGGAYTAPRPFLVPAVEQTRGEIDGIGRAKLEGL